MLSLPFITALSVTAAFTLAGAGYLAHTSWWPSVMVVASALSPLLLGLFASRYFIVGVPISVALAVWAWKVHS